MARTPAFHMNEPEEPKLYYDNSDCPAGKSIKPEHTQFGKGIGRQLCPWCEQH